MVLATEDFENGASGWSDNTTTSGGELTSFLGRFGGPSSATDGDQEVSKTFNFAGHEGETVTITFDMYRIDSWDGTGYNGEGEERFQVFVNGNIVSNKLNGDQADYTMTAGNEFTGWGSERINHYSIDAVVDVNGQIKLGFGSTLHQSIEDESWGVDNLVITAGKEATLQVDESDLGTNDNGIDFSASFTNTIYAGADGAKSVDTAYALGVTAGNSGLVDTATGENVVLSVNAGIVQGRTAGTNYLVFTVNTDNDGHVSLDQVRAIMHPNTSDNNEAISLVDDLITLTRTDKITDGDNDTAIDSATLNIGSNISFLDDAAIARNNQDTVVEGGAKISGNVITDNDGSGVDKEGADGAVLNEFTYTKVDGSSETLTFDSSNTTYIKTTPTGELTVNQDGTWEFTPVASVDHDNDETVGSFKYKLIDGDGDISNEATNTITVTDTSPSASVANSTLDEDDLSNGSDAGTDSLIAEQTLSIVKSQDDIADVNFDNATITALNALNLESNGAGITYTLSNSYHTITANNGTVDVFTIDLQNTSDASGATQKYKFELLDTIDHPSENAQNSVDLPFSFNIADIDSSVAGSTFKVTIIDDVPTANAEAGLSVVEGGVELTGMINLLNNDVQGADGATVTGFTYTNESGAVVSGTLGTAMNSQYGTLTVNSDGTWTYKSDDTEHNPNGTDAVRDVFIYTITDADGDTSSATQFIDVTDGANPTIDPADLTISEVTLGTSAALQPFTTQDNLLNVAKGSDNIADTKFANDLTPLSNLGIHSGGENIVYALSIDKHIITGIKATSGEEVLKIVITDPASTAAKYDFTLSLPIDHTQPSNDTEWTLPFSVYTVDTDDNGAVDGYDDASDTFNVTIQDSTPTADNQSIVMDEDSGSTTIRLSQDDFAELKIIPTNGAEVTVASGDITNIYDKGGDEAIGTLLNNGDGTVTFTPNADYSNYGSGTDLPYFNYTLTDRDGDTATAKVTIEVNPVSDAPTMQDNFTVSTFEDANTTDASKADGNQREGGDVKVIGLTLPTKNDQIDQNDSDVTDDSGTTIGDNSERLGTLNFSFDSSSNFGTATIRYDTNGDGILNGTLQTIDKNSTFSIDITDVANYHVSGTSGTYSLTQAQYESIAIIHEEDNATNIKITIETQSHEVKEDGSLLNIDVASTIAAQTVTLDVQAVTDDISLKFDNNGGIGTIVTTTNTDDTINLTAVDEDSIGTTIDLKALLTDTTGLQLDNSADLDGSEYRSYTISGVPEGTIVTFGDKTVAAGSAGTIEIPASWHNDTHQDVAFTMTIAPQYSGTVNATITLSVHDTDNDSNVTPDILTKTVYLDINVNPVADAVTLQVAQAKGFEDAGRTTGNTANDASAAVIDAPQNGIALTINPTTADTDGSETFTVTIAGIPDGGTLYYEDATNGTVTIDETGVITGANANISVVNDAGSAWHVVIADFDKTAPLTFIPPHNSDDNYLFDVSAYSVDGVSNTSVSPASLQIAVDVKGVADIPVNDVLASTTIIDDNSVNHNFTITAVEDTNSNLVDLKTIFANPAGLDSYDADSSEVLTMKVTGVDSGFDITGTGATLVTGTGESRVWFVDVTDLKAGHISLIRPSDFAGEMDFDVQFVTTEREGDSATHPVKNVTFMVTPAVDTPSMTVNETQNEDESKALTFGFSDTDTDGASAGIETLTTFSINVDGLEAAGVTLTSNGVDLTTGKSGYQSVALDANNIPDVIATLNEDSNLDGSYGFKISYTYTDTAVDANSNSYVDDSGSVVDLDYTVAVTSITDDITLTMNTTTGASNSVDAGGNVTVSGNGVFTKALHVVGVDSDGRGHLDQDGSEQFTRVRVDGVPEGITVGGADGVYAGDTDAGNYSGVWYVDIQDIALAGTASYDLTFDVDGIFSAADLGIYNITVTAFNEDSNNGVEQNDSNTFNLTVDTTFTGTHGAPSAITAFYQDIDNDETHDHAYIVTSSSDTTITDDNAYSGSVLREDTQFNLSDVIHAEVDTAGSSTDTFSITLKNVPVGVEIVGMTYNAAGDFYTLSGHGDTQSVVTALQSILVTPAANMNSDATDISGTDLAFDIELTTYTTGGTSNTALINFSGTVLPITDSMDMTVTNNDGTTLEDVDQTFSITLDNSADGAKTTIVDGKLYIQVNESYTDSNDGSDGTAGVLKDSTGATITTTETDPAGLVAGTYYVVSGVSYEDTLDFIYTPAEDRNGSVNVDFFVKNIEGETWSPYNTTEIVSTQTVTIDVTPVTDGYLLTSTANRVGNEDTLIALDVTVSNTDSSEILTSISLDGVPDGFLIYYGADALSATLAQNIGDNGTTDIAMTYGNVTAEVANLWNIPLSGAAVPAYIAIKPPENWSGTIPTMDVKIIDADGIETSNNLNVDVTPVVDPLTLHTTKTFGDEGTDIALNLNANIVDLDGSETVKLELTGLGTDTGFKVDGVEIDSGNVSYSGDTYTLTNIAAEDINSVTFVQSAMNADVSVNAYMVESDGSTSSVVTGIVNVDISAVNPTNSADTLLYDGNAIDALDGVDTIVFKQDQNVDSIDYSKLDNIEKIDLTANGNHTLNNVSLSDVLNMTDTNNTIEIHGDSGDHLNLSGGDYNAISNPSGWQHTTANGTATYSSTDGTDSVTLKVDDNITTSVI